MMMPFNTGSPDWVNRVQVMEQQLESVLGRGFIDVVPVGFPPTGFLDATRRAGNYAFQEVNWGPDFGDPETYFDPFMPGNTYSPIHTAQGWSGNFGRLQEAARAELIDTRRRFELFAQAEAYLIENAYVIPFRRGGGGYVASRLHPFTGAFSAFGVAGLSFKRQIVLERPMNMQQFNDAETRWQRERAAELKRWGQ
ncbi:MAG: Oligopeptide-binding protein SarA [Firmicutes bacterium]|nr:Oligopeptide-binding protein SarA [Bacillota bacterium]